MASTPPDTPSNTPTRKAAEEDVFMREVDEAVRQDEVAGFAKKYGWPIGIIVVLGLAAFAAYLFWSSQSEGKLEAGSEQLIAAIDELEGGNAKIADEEFAQIAAETEGGTAAIAKLMRAGIALGENRVSDATALYAEVADDDTLPKEMRDLALVRMVAANFDNMEPQEVIDRLGPLATPENAFYGSAGELVAFAYLAQDKEDQAGPLLAEIAKNEDVPQSLRSRTRQLAGLLGYDAIEDVDEVLEEMAVEQPIAAAGGQ